MRPKPHEQRASVADAQGATAKGLPRPAALPPFSAGRLPESAPRPASTRHEATARHIEAQPTARRPNIDATEEVSLADVSLESLSSAGGPLVATDRTEDISLEDVSLAALEVANDTELATSQELAASDPSLSGADLAPSKRSKRWLWAVGALGLLAGAGFVALEARPIRDAQKRDYALVGDALPAHGTGAVDGRALSGSQGSASVNSQAPVPSEPAPTLPAALAGTPPSPTATPEGAANALLQAAPESAGAAGTAPNDVAAEEVGTTANDAEEASAADQPEVAAEDQQALDTARRVALKRADGLVAQASTLRKRRKLELAANKYRAALAAYPDHPRALYGLVQVAIQQHDGKQAVQLARDLVEAKPDQASYLVLLGDAYKAAGKPKDAREAWQSAARQGSAVARKRLK